MEIQHNAIVKNAYKQDIKFIYAVHHYQGLLDYIETEYFATEEKAREVFKTKYGIMMKEIIENGLEIYNETEEEIYFEGDETCEKLLIEAIIIPQ